MTWLKGIPTFVQKDGLRQTGLEDLIETPRRHVTQNLKLVDLGDVSFTLKDKYQYLEEIPEIGESFSSKLSLVNFCLCIVDNPSVTIAVV